MSTVLFITNSRIWCILDIVSSNCHGTPSSARGAAKTNWSNAYWTCLKLNYRYWYASEMDRWRIIRATEGIENLRCVLYVELSTVGTTVARSRTRTNTWLRDAIQGARNPWLYCQNTKNQTPLMTDRDTDDHRFQFCPKCGITWNRDVNTAHNIALVALEFVDYRTKYIIITKK